MSKWRLCPLGPIGWMGGGENAYCPPMDRFLTIIAEGDGGGGEKRVCPAAMAVWAVGRLNRLRPSLGEVNWGGYGTTLEASPSVADCGGSGPAYSGALAEPDWLS